VPRERSVNATATRERSGTGTVPRERIVMSTVRRERTGTSTVPGKQRHSYNSKGS